MSISLKELMTVNVTEFLFLSSLIKHQTFVFPRKNESICRKKMSKHNIQRVENSVVKGGNACVEKGFNVQTITLLFESPGCVATRLSLLSS